MGLRRLHFLLIFALLMCSGSIWFVLRLHAAARQHAAAEAVVRLGGRVSYDLMHRQYGTWLGKAGLAKRAWLRRLLGDDFFDWAYEVVWDFQPIGDADLVHLQGWASLKKVSLIRTKIHGAGLVHLGSLTRLETLCLDDSQVSDAGLENLRPLAWLRWLSLDRSAITDAGLAHLQALAALESL
jgi:hypothetical protein